MTQLNLTITWANANLNGKPYVLYVTASLDIIITNNNLFVLPLERSPFLMASLNSLWKQIYTRSFRYVVLCKLYTTKSKSSFSLISMELIELRSLLNLALIIWFKSWTFSASFRLYSWGLWNMFICSWVINQSAINHCSFFLWLNEILNESDNNDNNRSMNYEWIEYWTNISKIVYEICEFAWKQKSTSIHNETELCVQMQMNSMLKSLDFNISNVIVWISELSVRKITIAYPFCFD